MSQIRMSARLWALTAIGIMSLAEAFLFFYPTQADENQIEPKPPLTIKISCAHGSEWFRLEFDRDSDPNQGQVIDVRDDLRIWVPGGTTVYFEENEKLGRAVSLKRRPAPSAISVPTNTP